MGIAAPIPTAITRFGRSGPPGGGRRTATRRTHAAARGPVLPPSDDGGRVRVRDAAAAAAASGENRPETKRGLRSEAPFAVLGRCYLITSWCAGMAVAALRAAAVDDADGGVGSPSCET